MSLEIRIQAARFDTTAITEYLLLSSKRLRQILNTVAEVALGDAASPHLHSGDDLQFFECGSEAQAFPESCWNRRFPSMIRFVRACDPDQESRGRGTS